MHTKRGIEIKEMDQSGHGLARIATLSAINSDGDTYQAGAFGEQFAQILPAHNWQALPLGKARIFERGDEALAELHLNLETQAGKDWHAALKFDLAAGQPPVQEWSYGFEVLDADVEQRNGKPVRVLKKLAVHEVSPVVRGAGEGTATLAMKNAALKEGHFERLASDLAELAAAVKDGPGALSAAGLKQLMDLHEGIGTVIAEATFDRDLPGRLAAGHIAFATRHHLPGR